MLCSALFTHFMMLWALSMATTLEDPQKFLDEANKKYADACYNYGIASWDYETDMTDEKQKKMLELGDALSKVAKELWEKIKPYPWKEFTDQSMYRQFEALSNIWTAALPDEKSSKFEDIVAKMGNNYSSVQVCDYKNREKCNLHLDPEIVNIMADSRDEAELNFIWNEWMDKAGKPIRPMYPEYVSLYNEAAKINGFSTAAELWQSEYYNPKIENFAAELWDQIHPLYVQLHAYMRRKLRDKYGEDLVSKKGAIPVHLTGDIWGLTWEHVLDLPLPFPEIQKPDVTKAMVDQGYTPIKIFKTAEEFYTSIGLSQMKESFWKNSVFERIPNREMDCHAQAWDFCNGEDFRIKICAQIKEEYFYTGHHEMGHTQYQMQYAKLPFLLRDGANPGFHEAMGDLISLSVSTEKHLHKIGLLPEISNSKEEDLNHLFRLAAEKIAFMPFGYVVDLWRWQVFRGEVTPDNYNCKWWELVVKLQGVKPPKIRTEKDFDAAAKWHVSNDYRYISYFFAHVLQFQFHEALCIKAKEFDANNPEKPLHRCDIYQNKDAGSLLKQVMELGWSKPWEDTLQLMTGERNMDASAIIQFFSPLIDWLKEDNKKNGEYIGWETEEKVCETS